MTILSRAVPLLLAAFFVVAADQPPPTADVVAQRGDVALTSTDLRDTLSLLDPTARAKVTATTQSLTNFVRERVLDLSVLAEADAKKWDAQPDIARRIKEARDAVILQTYLASLVPPDPNYPTDADVTAAYDNNKSRLVLPRQFHIAQIVLTVKPDATPQEEEAVHKKAMEIRALALKPKADFADLARKYSQEQPSGQNGGDVGWLREPDMMPSVREVVQGMAENGVSQPLHVPDGWHILKLLAIKPAGQVSLQDARPQIIQALRQARAQKFMRSYLDQMIKAEPIEVNEIELTKAVGEAK